MKEDIKNIEHLHMIERCAYLGNRVEDKNNIKCKRCDLKDECLEYLTKKD
jgi:hypothetical protein